MFYLIDGIHFREPNNKRKRTKKKHTNSVIARSSHVKHIFRQNICHLTCGDKEEKKKQEVLTVEIQTFV